MLGVTIPVNTTWLPAALALIAVVVMMNLLRRRQARRGPAESAQERVARIRDAAEARGATDDFLIKLETVSRQVSAQIDTKIAKLEALLQDVDARTARLQAISDSVDRLRARLANRPLDRPPATQGRSGDGSSGATTPTPFSRGVAPPGATAPAPGSAASAPSVPPPPGSDTIPAGPSTAGSVDLERIYRLSDAGTPAVRIAELLGMQRGEVELVLDLRDLR